LQKVEINKDILCFIQKEEGHPPEETKLNNKLKPFGQSQQEDQPKTVQESHRKLGSRPSEAFEENKPIGKSPDRDQRKPVEKYQHKPPDERKSTNLRKFSEPNQPSEIRQFFKELRPPDIGIPYTGSGPVKSSVEAGHSSVEAKSKPTSVEVGPHHPSRIQPAESGPGLVKAALRNRQPDPLDSSSAHSQSTEVQSSLPFHSSGIRPC
jgi:hypothetical protein